VADDMRDRLAYGEAHGVMSAEVLRALVGGSMFRFASRRPLIAVLAAFIALILTASVAVATSWPVSGKALKALKAVSADKGVVVQPPNWTDVPDMSATMAVPSGEMGLFLATFSAEARAAGGGDCLIQIVLNNGPVLVPGPVTFVYDTDFRGAFGSYSMQFVAGPYGPGQYQFKVQARNEFTQEGSHCAIRRGPLSVLRSKV
jgi:hypothetical protein